FFFLLIPRPPLSTLFPYTTLFRSVLGLGSVFARRLRQVALGIGAADHPADRRDRFRRHVDAIGAHISDQADRLAAQPYAFIQLRSEEHTSELQSRSDLVCRLLLEK